MKLIALSASNFMPYKGKFEIAFPTDSDRNVMLVFGDNMRGKTSLLNALRWVFYGKALGRHAREIPMHELLNKEAALEGDWQVDASIVFEADGHRFELRRRATKRALVSKPSRPEDYEIIRHLKKDEMVVADHLIDGEINRFAPEQVSRFFLFDGELLQEYESLLIEGSEQGRKIKDAIEQVLGVPTLIHGRDEAQTLLKAAQKQQSKDLEKVAGLEKQTERQVHLQTQRESFERDLQVLGDMQKKTRSDRADLDDFIEKTEAVYEAKAQLTAKTDRRNEIVGRQDLLAQERLALLKDAWRELLRPQLTLKLEQINESHDGLTAQVIQRSRVEARIEQLQQSLETQICPSCGQEVHPEQREKAGAELGTLQAQIRVMTVDAEAMQRISAEIRDLSRLLRAGPAARLAEADRELARLSVGLTKTENEMEKLSDQIQGQDTAEIARRRALRDGLLKEEGRLDRDIKDAQAKLEGARRDLAMIAKVLENIPAARSAKSTQMVSIYGSLDRLFSKSIDRLREDLRQR